jgi:hypothetical protein
MYTHLHPLSRAWHFLAGFTFIDGRSANGRITITGPGLMLCPAFPGSSGFPDRGKASRSKPDHVNTSVLLYWRLLYSPLHVHAEVPY